MALREVLRTFIENELVRGQSDVNVEEVQLVESGIIDSLGIMKLVEFIENQTQTKIEDTDLVPENFETLETICAFVDNKNK